MRDEATNVLIGGYLSKDAATEDYEAIVASGAEISGAVVVSKDLEGNVSIEETDHIAKKGAIGLGGVGLVVGLFAPPLLAATAVGAAIGGAAGHVLHSKVRSKIEEQAADTIPVGGAGLLVAYPHSSADVVDKAVTRAIRRAVGEAEGMKVEALKEALAEAQEKMGSDQ